VKELVLSVLNINVREHHRPRAIKMDNPEKMTPIGTQDEDKQSKKHNTMCAGHHYMQRNTNNVNKT
jgi:hypothetical protein